MLQPEQMDAGMQSAPIAGRGCLEAAFAAAFRTIQQSPALLPQLLTRPGAEAASDFCHCDGQEPLSSYHSELLNWT